MFRKLFLVTIALNFFCSCAQLDQQEAIPSYVHIPSLKLQVSPDQGSSFHQFKDVWVYANNEYVGAYEMPVTIPIVAEGNTEIKIYAGFRKNGMVTQPTRYPFLDPYVINVPLEKTKTDTILPVLFYGGDVKFPFIEDFERIHFFNEEIDGDQETKVILTAAADAFEGANSGEITVSNNHPILEAWYDIPKPIPVSPNQIYMELHYKSDIPFYVGFIGYKAGESPTRLINALVLPKSNWNKIYFDFTDILNNYRGASYKMAVAAAYIKDTAKTEQHIYLDNFKVTHR